MGTDWFWTLKSFTLTKCCFWVYVIMKFSEWHSGKFGLINFWLYEKERRETERWDGDREKDRTILLLAVCGEQCVRSVILPSLEQERGFRWLTMGGEHTLLFLLGDNGWGKASCYFFSRMLFPAAGYFLLSFICLAEDYSVCSSPLLILLRAFL